jgi:uncharacterized protein (TIGR02646 family)
MRHVSFRPSLLTNEAERKWFARWLRRARRATRELIADVEAGRPLEFKPQIWSDLKEFLLKGPFRGKCAYCESRVTTTDFGDAEHYRPKNGVTCKDADGKTKFVEIGGAAHPGYYWLAYDWRNLLPACVQCNSGSGKMNQFPISDECSHAMNHSAGRTPAALDAIEKPRLLHPYQHQPENFLRFGQDGTIAAAENDPELLGDASIKTYNLTRGDLDITRHEYQEKAWGEFLKALMNDNPPEAAMGKYERGEAPYSLACVQYVKLKYRRAASGLGLS